MKITEEKKLIKLKKRDLLVKNKKVDVIDLAKYIISFSVISNPLLLQKVLFLVRQEELKEGKDFGVFKEEDNFEAWINGPVNVKVYNAFRLYFYGEEEEDPYILNDKEKEAFFNKYYFEYVKKYLTIYNNSNVWVLVDLAKENLAWINARKDLADNTPSHIILNNDEIGQVTEKFNKLLEKYTKGEQNEK